MKHDWNSKCIITIDDEVYEFQGMFEKEHFLQAMATLFDVHNEKLLAYRAEKQTKKEE